MTDLRTPPVRDGDILFTHVREHACERPLQRIQILVAGCGWGDTLHLGDTDHHVTGVDADVPALRAHTTRRHDLDTWRLGDLRSVPLPPRAYDIVYAPYLIDRVRHAELILDRVIAALRPGGLLLVRLRDRATAHAFLDRVLPGRPPLRGLRPGRPGRPGRHGRWHGDGPPPAVYEQVASLEGMRWYCVMRGLLITEEYTSRDTMSGYGRWNGVVRAACRLVSLCSRGRLSWRHSDVTLVIRKPENRYARVL